MYHFFCYRQVAARRLAIIVLMSAAGRIRLTLRLLQPGFGLADRC